MSFLCRLLTSSVLISREAYLCQNAIKRFQSTYKSKSRNVVRLSLIGATAGALIGTGYTIHRQNNAKDHLINEVFPIPVIQNVPKIQPSRKVTNNFDASGLKLTLYQYQTCPFCCKVRAFLDYYGIPYNVIEVDPVLRQSIRWSEYKKVPILVAEVEGGYQQFNDSSMIISSLSSYLKDTSQSLEEVVSAYPNITFFDENGSKLSEIMNKYFIMFQTVPKNITTEQLLEERKWRKWADEVLVHVLSPNVYRTPKEALQAFNWFSDVGEWEKNFPAWERAIIVYVGASAMWLIGKRLKSRHNLKDDVRISLYDECNRWVKEINKKGTPFMGGDKPNLADISVYGILNSIEGCDAFKDLLIKSKISTWYNRMKDSINNHKGKDLINI